MKKHRIGRSHRVGRGKNLIREAVIQGSVKLMMGKRLEVIGKGGDVFYLGSSTENRRDPFWLESKSGRIYKERPEELLEKLIPHVGTEAIERAKVFDR